MAKEPVRIFVNELVLEITQRCNMHCQHCIRGEARNKDIAPQIITQLLKTARIYSVTFSGGEPALNVPAIRDYFNKAKKYNNYPSHFYVVTNGSVNQRQLAHTLLDAYGECEEQEMCGLVVSKDMFHDKAKQNAAYFAGLAFYDPNDHSHPLNESFPEWVINDGTANETGWGYRPPHPLTTRFDDIIEYVTNDAEAICIDTLYVTADGYVVSDCDASYERMDEEHICRVSDLPELARDCLDRHKAEKNRLSYADRRRTVLQAANPT